MENYKPLVSVIINCYNGEKYLREAIDSVIAQTYTNWELIFWDNQSTDSTADIVKSYNDERIHYYYAPEHTPLGEARNLAVGKATGEYINFLDADDFFLEKKFESQIQLIEKGVSEVIISKYQIKVECGQHINKALLALFVQNQKYFPHDNSFYRDILKCNRVAFSTVLFNKSLYCELGGVDPTLQQNEDYDILLKCSLHTNVKSTTEPLAVYRIHGNNTSNKLCTLGLYENRRIFNHLPQDKYIQKAIKKNETTLGYYMIVGEKNFFKGMIHIYRYGNYRNLIVSFFNKIYRYLILLFKCYDEG